MSEKVLTAKQERFVQEFLVDLNATQAAIRAGYSAKTAAVIACENLKKPYIQEAIAQARLKMSERTALTTDWVIERLMKINTRCMEEEPVRDKSGTVVPGKFVFHPQGANRSAELLGKHLGMFVDKVAPTDPSGKREYGAGLTDEQRAARILAYLERRRQDGDPTTADS